MNSPLKERPSIGLVTWVALIILFFFAVIVIYMFKRTSANEIEWGRAVYIYGGVEAVAFAAAGFLFGREVNRQRAESAESRAEKNELRATAGQTLADVIRAKAAQLPQDNPLYEHVMRDDPSKLAAAVHSDWSELLAIANRHFS